MLCQPIGDQGRHSREVLAFCELVIGTGQHLHAFLDLQGFVEPLALMQRDMLVVVALTKTTAKSGA